MIEHTFDYTRRRDSYQAPAAVLAKVLSTRRQA